MIKSFFLALPLSSQVCEAAPSSFHMFTKFYPVDIYASLDARFGRKVLRRFSSSLYLARLEVGSNLWAFAALVALFSVQ